MTGGQKSWERKGNTLFPRTQGGDYQLIWLGGDRADPTNRKKMSFLQKQSHGKRKGKEGRDRETGETKGEAPVQTLLEKENRRTR